MMYLKACPKCKGDMIDENDHYGHYSSCVQCGFSKPAVTNDVAALMKEVAADSGRHGRPAGHRRYVAHG